MNQLLQSKSAPFALITISLLIGLTLPFLLQDGMFMDAAMYTAVSHNLSLGIGTFWFPEYPYYNLDHLTSFHEQPPLAFGIQALFFKILGSSIYTERIYTIVCLFITALLIVRIFGLFKSEKKTWWLPLLLWFSIPLAFWSFQNNMHENTMGIFVLLSVYFSLNALISEQKSVLKNGVLSGLFIACAALTKGVPGLFPLAVPIIFWMLHTKKLKRAIILFVVIILSLVAISTVLYLYPDSRESLTFYIRDRLLNRINNHPTVDSRFETLYRLITELIPAIAIAVLIRFSMRSKDFKPKNEILKNSLFLILIGLSGTLPLMLTLVQRGFYFVPALPFFAIAIALLIEKRVGKLQDLIFESKRTFTILRIVGILALVVSISASVFAIGKTTRHKDLLFDVHVLGEYLPKNTVVKVTPIMLNEWAMHAYLMRYYQIATDYTTNEKRSYFLCLDKMECELPDGYQLIDLKTKHLRLYKLKE